MKYHDSGKWQNRDRTKDPVQSTRLKNFQLLLYHVPNPRADGDVMNTLPSATENVKFRNTNSHQTPQVRTGLDPHLRNRT